MKNKLEIKLSSDRGSTEDGSTQTMYPEKQTIVTFDYLLINQPLKQHQNDSKIITM